MNRAFWRMGEINLKNQRITWENTLVILQEWQHYFIALFFVESVHIAVAILVQSVFRTIKRFNVWLLPYGTVIGIAGYQSIAVLRLPGNPIILMMGMLS